jgi:hypothetical protein
VIVAYAGQDLAPVWFELPSQQQVLRGLVVFVLGDRPIQVWGHMIELLFVERVEYFLSRLMVVL